MQDALIIKIATRLRELCEDSTDSDEEVSFYNGYSGRGMYGRKCIGITSSQRNCLRMIGELIKEFHEEDSTGDHRMLNDFNEVVDTLLDYNQDNMGRDTIIYWPELDAIEEVEPEHDGQPDEAQEWHDFDPDC